ncbi:MAG: HDOD domain-containing protein, partial [Phycisphaerae bacterium]
MSSHNVVDRSNIAQEILDSVRIPSLPEAAVKLLSLCRDDQVSAGEIVGVVEMDPALSTRVLKLANSAAFGQQHRVSTLTRAAVVLGNENLKVVALGFYLSAGWEGMGFAGFDIREFWRDSVIRACLARRLAKCADYQPAQTAFLVGMIQDIGTLILGTHFGALYG